MYLSGNRFVGKIQTRDPMSGQRSRGCLAFSGQLNEGGYPVVRETKIDGHTEVRITVVVVVGVVVMLQA